MLLKFVRSFFVKFASVVLLCLSFSQHSYATVVEVRTNMGNFQINLFDEEAPRHVANFLRYVDEGAYTSNVVHRAAFTDALGLMPFVLQMGGFQYEEGVLFPTLLERVPRFSPVTNEPVLSNVRGTLAMAKSAGNPNSATSEFFVNVADNSGAPAFLDTQNAGFTVFGQIIGDGMDVVDDIMGLTIISFFAPFNDVPLRNFTFEDAANAEPITSDHVVVINEIVVIGDRGPTNTDLMPAPNTLINAPPPVVTPDPVDNDSDSGGSMGIMLLLGLFSTALMRRKK